MQTSKWGKSGWTFLHTIAHNYDPSKHKKSSFKALFTEILGDVLPCIYCRNSYSEFSSSIPIDKYLNQKNSLENETGLAYWLYLVHNKVNNKLRGQGLYNKEDPTWPMVFMHYEQFRADCTKKKDLPSTCRVINPEKRCKALTEKGRQCSRLKKMNNKCSQHLKCIGGSGHGGHGSK